MLFSLKTKIWLTVLSIVLMFTFFTLFYFPWQQGNILLKNYNNEMQNLANTVALGVKIAMKEQNFEGVKTAMDFVTGDSRLKFAGILQYDTSWDESHSKYTIRKSVFKTYPDKEDIKPEMQSDDSTIIKSSAFNTSTMSGAILLGFSTNEINQNTKKIKLIALTVSGSVLFIGILISLWLGTNISVPVMALRDAALRIGEGDLSQRVKTFSKDEIGELGKAFNKMVDDLSHAREELGKTNSALSGTNEALNNTLRELKATQIQLIHTEKMASLGELTAGIAHEIQNPLNFINNFSEVSVELAAELKEELEKSSLQPAEIEMINPYIRDLVQNQQKINHHGMRAAAIVNGMLQHSRSSAGKKEPAEINPLVNEYLRLSYHGLRAKDKSFNATMETDFDPAVGKINIVPQDVGRVVLNLFTNAFYSVNEKRKIAASDYKPTVCVSTRMIKNAAGDSQLEIRVRDNGNGIPHQIMAKIYQPFFTTKPTGEGTGLGLSLSYDIITKGHGGSLTATAMYGEYAEFVILIPAFSIKIEE